MSIRLEKIWQWLDKQKLLLGQLGVFQLADDQNQILFIGYAGGHSSFGLRSEIHDSWSRIPEATCYRLEINSAYLTRYQELLMVYVADHGALPPLYKDGIKLGRLSPT